MGSLSDIVALVAGASRGIGRGIALALGEAGATSYQPICVVDKVLQWIHVCECVCAAG